VEIAFKMVKIEDGKDVGEGEKCEGNGGMTNGGIKNEEG
jgi:hypothetical protein